MVYCIRRSKRSLCPNEIKEACTSLVGKCGGTIMPYSTFISFHLEGDEGMNQGKYFSIDYVKKWGGNMIQYEVYDHTQKTIQKARNRLAKESSILFNN